MTWSRFICNRLAKMAKLGTSKYSTDLKSSRTQFSCTDYCSELKDVDAAYPGCLTGIMCELGTVESNKIESMIKNGMRIAKLNCFQCSHVHNGTIIDNFRRATMKYKELTGICLPFAVVMETCGSSTRTSQLSRGLLKKVELRKGEAVKIVLTESLEGNLSSEHKIYVRCPYVNMVLTEHSLISIDDGTIILKVKNHVCDVVECTVEKAGMLGSFKPVHIPSVSIGLTENDEEDIRWGIKQGIDMIVTLADTAEHVDVVKRIVAEEGNRVKVFAKIESLPGWKNFEGILGVADGIFIDRDALSNIIQPQKLFSAQKAMISLCNKIGKPLIVGGQVMNSMVQTSQPSWSESLDISTLVLDGADCIELSAGQYPEDSVATLSAICREAESAVQHNQLFLQLTDEVQEPLDANHAAAISAVKAAISSKAKSIICITTTGETALLLARYSPPCPVVAVTRDPRVAKEMLFYRALMPILYEVESEPDRTCDVEDYVRYGMTYGVAFNFLKIGDPVIVISRWKKSPGFKDSVRIQVECVNL